MVHFAGPCLFDCGRFFAAFYSPNYKMDVVDDLTAFRIDIITLLIYALYIVGLLF